MKKAVLLLAILFIATATMAQTTWHVKSGGDDAKDGKTWANAFETLQAALDVAVSGDQIWVAAGTYNPTKIPDESGNPTTDRDKAFVMIAGVKIYGGFAGTETALANRNWETNVTVLSGIFGLSNAYHHVVISAGVVGDACLDGFTITGGSADANDNIVVNTYPIERSYGGGIYCVNSSPALTNLIITNNGASNGGGIATFREAAPVLTDVIISGNNANVYGGGMYNTSSNPALNRVRITNNTALENGGGVYNNGQNNYKLIMNDVIISENTAYGDGGGMYNTMYNPVLTNVTISENTAGGVGGGICNSNYSTPALTNVTINDNTASQGGGMFSDVSTPVLNRVSIKGNTAMEGGGMYNSQSPAVLANVLIFENTATNDGGGGMYNYSSSPVLTNVTIADNEATGGSGIYNGSGNAPTLNNSIVWGNNTDGVFDEAGIATIYSHSLIQGNLFAAADPDGNIDDDDVSGDVFRGANDYRLAEGCPAIGAGDITPWTDVIYNFNTESLFAFLGFASMSNVTDFQGKQRVMDGTIEMGAYEYSGNDTPSDDTSISAIEYDAAQFNQIDTLDYQVLCGVSGGSFSFIVKIAAGAALSGDGVSGDTLTVNLPRPGMYGFPFTVTAADGITKGNYTLTIELLYDFDYIIDTRWNNTLMTYMNRLNNDGFDAASFRWFRGGVQIANEDKSVYSVGVNATDLLSTTEEYYLEMTMTDGEIIRSCSKLITHTKTAKNMTVYPNPTKGLVRIDTEGTPNIKVYNIYGTLINTVAGTEVNLHGLPSGLYIFEIDNQQISIIKE